MTIATLTFASMRISHAAPAPAPVAAAPVAAPAPAKPKADDAGCAYPGKRSGLSDAVKRCCGSDDDAPHGLRDAVLDFARALMQALREPSGAPSRGERGRDDDGDEGRRHGHRHGHGLGRHRHHDGEGYGLMRHLGDRIHSLAQSLAPAAPAAPAPAAAPTPATNVVTWPAPSAPVAEAPAEGASVPAIPEPAAPTPAGGWTAEVVVARFHIDGQAMPYARLQDKLLDAFAQLRQAQGAPQAPDRDTLRSELGAFLERLAAGLGADTAESLGEPTAPGALLDLAA